MEAKAISVKNTIFKTKSRHLTFDRAAEKVTGLEPFLKWAGGKRWFVRRYLDYLPSSYNQYIEPFLGGGALYFHLCPSNAVISDANYELMETYRAIRNNWRRVFNLLKDHQRLHCKKYYYSIRDAEFTGRYERAAKFLYLNRTCWNGLYRVNKNGKFNVPIGTKNTVIFKNETFSSYASVLRNTTIISVDFEDAISIARRNDFIFIDPPYTVKHNNNGFVKYNENIFSWSDQERLAVALNKANRKGVKFIMLNADHKSVIDLYKNFEILRLDRQSVIAANSDFRGGCTEIFVRNYANE